MERFDRIWHLVVAAQAASLINLNCELLANLQIVELLRLRRSAPDSRARWTAREDSWEVERFRACREAFPRDELPAARGTTIRRRADPASSSRLPSAST